MSSKHRPAPPQRGAVAAKPGVAATALPVLSAVVLVGVPTVLTTRAANPFSVVELAALGVLAAAGLVLVTLNLTTATGSRLPDPLVLAVLGFLLLSLLLATGTSDRRWLSVVGAEGRNSGLLLYLSCLLVLLMAYRSVQLAGPRLLLLTVALLGALQVVVSGLQLIGMNWPDLTQVYGTPVVGTLGNPNFASAILGIVTPVLCWVAVTESPKALRVGAAMAAAAAFGLSLATGSIQGPVAAAAGLLVLVAVGTLPALQRATGRLNRRHLPWLIGAVALGLVAAAVVGRFVLARGTLEVRLHYWRVASRIFRDDPLLGVGLDRYGASFTRARSPETLDALGPTAFTNAAHSVPLQMATSGGILLLLAYLAFVSLVAAALISGVRRYRGDATRRWALGAAGGAWLAYQVQSLVSIDQPPLAMLHFVLAGVVLALSWGDRGRVLARPRRSAVVATATGLSALCALVIAYLCLLPLRADLAIREGNLALRSQDGMAAMAAFDRAGRIADWDPRPSFYRGQLLDRAGERKAALPLLVDAAADEPGSAAYALAAATEAATLGDAALVQRLANQALAADPLSPETRTDVGILLVTAGETERGADLLEAVVAQGRALSRTWAGLGDARRVSGDLQGARQAYEQALALDPSNAAVTARLEQLPPES